jgi:hypothetical protein
MIRKTLAALASLVLTAVSAFLIKLVIERARLPYENGRYFDPVESVVYDEGAVMVYGLLAGISVLATLGAIWVAHRASRSNDARA